MGFPWICPCLMVKKRPRDSGQMCYLKSKIIGGNKYLARHSVGPDHVECTCLLDPRVSTSGRWKSVAPLLKTITGRGTSYAKLFW